MTNVDLKIRNKMYLGVEDNDEIYNMNSELFIKILKFFHRSRKFMFNIDYPI